MIFMNKKKTYAKAVLYNFINSFLFVFVGAFSSLKLFANSKASLQILIVALCAILSSALYWFFMPKNCLLKDIFFRTVINTGLFVLFTALNFVLYYCIKPVSTGELNSAFGLWIMLLLGIYLLSGFVLKLVAIIVYFVQQKNKVK